MIRNNSNVCSLYTRERGFRNVSDGEISNEHRSINFHSLESLLSFLAFSIDFFVLYGVSFSVEMLFLVRLVK